MTDQSTPTWRLLHLASGDAAGLLRRWRTEGKTHDQIAHDLMTTYGIKVSREWVRLRCVDLGIKSAA